MLKTTNGTEIKEVALVMGGKAFYTHMLLETGVIINVDEIEGEQHLLVHMPCASSEGDNAIVVAGKKVDLETKFHIENIISIIEDGGNMLEVGTYFRDNDFYGMQFSEEEDSFGLFLEYMFIQNVTDELEVLVNA